MKVALVHDWLTGMRGGERVLQRIARKHPEAPIYTLVWNRGSMAPDLEAHPIRTSFLQRIPGATERYRWLLPLFPAAIESFDLTGYDVVISTSHAVAKSVRPAPGAFHLSYVHTPMRYIWELESVYFPPGRFGWPLDGFVHRTCARLREWDVATAHRAHALLANSAHVAARIRRHYGRDSEVVHPPVDVDRFAAADGPRDFFLLAGAFAPYKRSDLAIEACAALGCRLVVAGSGQEADRLQQIAGPDVRFTGWTSDDQLAGLYTRARALLFPGEEDFGIVPVEAMASGCPVVALGRGGVLETVGRGASASALARIEAGGAAVVPGGVLFGSQTVEGLVEAIRLVESTTFDPHALRAQAEPFSPEAFDRGFEAAFDRAFAAWRSRQAA